MYKADQTASVNVNVSVCTKETKNKITGLKITKSDFYVRHEIVIQKFSHYVSLALTKFHFHFMSDFL